MVTKAEHVVRPTRTSGPYRISLSRSIVAGIAALADAAVVIGTGFLIYMLYVLPKEPDRLLAYSAGIGAFMLLIMQAFYMADLYRFVRIKEPSKQVPRIAGIIGLAFLVLIGFAFALKISDDFSRVWSFTWFGSMLFLIVLCRYALAAFVRGWARHGRLGRNIMIYGGGDQAERLIKHIDAINEPWNRITGVFDDRLERVGNQVCGYPVLGNLKDLITCGRSGRGADEVLIALPWAAEQRLMSIMAALSVLPTDIRLAPEFVGNEMLRRRTSFQYGVPMLRILDKPVSGWAAVTKYVMDYTLGSLFLVLSLPIILTAAICIKLESRGPVFFRQQRYGFNSQLIDIFKFRTMYVDQTDAAADKLATRNDPRITKVGAFLRRFSLDELPQLFNVLRGEMSVVGPRPHALRAKAGGKLYKDVIDEYAVRYKVKPGITGWAQVNGWRGNTETERDLIGRIEHDLHYIEHWSIPLDLSIIMRTVTAVIGGKNSY
jgi:Undecaprenyl-phosphate glucose phosphotransferase